jgi:hypothetical protein
MAVRDQTIRDASQTLLDLLKTGLPDINVDLRSPKDPAANLLTLFLYKVRKFCRQRSITMAA